MVALRQFYNFVALARPQIVVERKINTLCHEVHTCIRHHEMSAARMWTLETAGVLVALARRRNGARNKRVQRNRGSSERKVRCISALVGALIRHRFASQERIAEAIGDLLKAADPVAAAKYSR